MYISKYLVYQYTNNYKSFSAVMLCPIYLKNRGSGLIYRTLTFCILIMSMSGLLTAQTQNIELNDSSKTVVETVKDFSEKDNFISRFLKTILVNDDVVTQHGNTIHDADKKLIRKYTGKIIRKINVEVLDVFGASVDHPKDTVRSWLQDNGN